MRCLDLPPVLLLFGVLAIYGYAPSFSWLWLIPIIVVNYIMIVACSFVGACLVCYVRDFSMLISLSMVFLLFTSGIFWDVRNLGDPHKTEMVLALNPLAFLLDAYRQVMMYQQAPDLVHLSYIGLGFSVVALVMIGVMRRTSQYLALKAITS